ncbi:pilus assembly protein [Pseudomonas sp. NPDC077649]|uniref:pilus assembly protein n=1 Tax=Pseudomonas sp. NPDC077649 TaxID=3364423 RepID=UPI0037C55277
MQAAMASFTLRALLAALLTGASLQAAWAFTPAQSPLNLGGQVEPNILFILDDSGSMRWGFMPDELRPSYMESGQGWYNQAECTGRGAYGGAYTHFCSKGTRRYLTSSHLNKVYFNPAVTYLPPIKSDGQRFASASFSAAWLDGYAGSATVDLRSNYMATMDDYFAASSYECLNRRCDNVRYYRGFAIGNASGGVAAFYHDYVGGGSCASNPRQDSCYAERAVSADQQQNFANWFSYYRTRMLAAKAGVSQAFHGQGGDIRVGYGAINLAGNTVDGVATDTLVRGVRRFEGSGRSDFYDWLFAAQASGSTPLRKALGDAGEYYSRADARGPWNSTPGASGGQDYACRQSYSLLTTDGYWNGDGAANSDAQGNVDNGNGPTISGPDGATYRYVPKSPFRDNHAGTLADVAMYYWSRDLIANLANRVPTSPANPAFWQHMVTFGIGLGVSGSVDAQQAFAAIGSGAALTWPDPSASEPAKIDDLLHAAVNSRGEFFSAQDPQSFAKALSDTLGSIAVRNGSNTAAVPSARRLDSETLVYEANFSSADWSGKLLAKRPTQTSTGIVFSDQWEAGRLINPSARRLFGHSGAAGSGQGLALNWSGLSSGMRGHFDNNQALFDYLMGSDANEAPAGLKYRSRSTLLGDIVNSTLVLANKQNWGFQGRVPAPGNGAQDYNAFVAGKAGRTPTLFVGANDGFLHAFDANSGRELFAYMPSGVLSNVKQLAASDYNHRYFVDGGLQVRDAVLDGRWRSVLVGSLGAGGKTVFALDVTDTSSSGFDASKVLWEIKDDADLGHVFGDPVIGRLKDGKWVAIFGNGHGSTNDDSVLLIVDLASGELNKVRAGAATGGLSSPSFVYARDDDGYIYVDAIYAGDLSGNLWKFNLKNNGSGADDFEVSLRSGGRPQPLYVASDSSGKRQPITVKPEIAPHPQEGFAGNMIFFGSGRMYSAGDVTDRSTQSFYGIWDKPTSNGGSIAFTGRGALDARSILFEGRAHERLVRVLDRSAGLNWATQRGWYLDLTSPVSGAQGERVIHAPSILLNRLVVQTAIPSSDPCMGGGSGWTLVLDLGTGGRLNYTLFDMNKDGSFDSGDTVLVDGVPMDVSGLGSEGGIPTGGYDLLDDNKYWLCRGTGVDDCIPAANGLNVIEGRQSWNQIK